MPSISGAQGFAEIERFFHKHDSTEATAAQICAHMESSSLKARSNQVAGLLKRMTESGRLIKVDRGIYRLPDGNKTGVESAISAERIDIQKFDALPVEKRIEQIFTRNITMAAQKIQSEVSREILHISPDQLREIQEKLRKLQELCQ